MGDDRLTREDWVRAGLKALSQEGAGALKADRLARELGVSRGSFYWHFADVGAFHAAVLDGWQSVAYDAIVEGLARFEDNRLPRLIAGALKSDGRLEKAIRAWAAHDARARAKVQVVDARRIAYLREELQNSGRPKRLASARAHVIYWTYLGSFLGAEPPTLEMLADVAQELARLAAADMPARRR